MVWRRLKSQRIAAITVAGCLGITTFVQAQFTSFSNRSRAMLEGNWQSCRESDGQYGERVYEGKWPGMGAFELHMGPYHEFALFRGIQAEVIRPRDSTLNLTPERYLTPEFAGILRGVPALKGPKNRDFSGISVESTARIGYTQRAAGTTSAYHLALLNWGNRDI